MNLPPALTWLNLFPANTPCACESGPDWFRKLIDQRPRGQRAVRVVCDTQWNALGDLHSHDSLALINCGGLSKEKLKAAGFEYVRQFAVLPSLEKARWFIPLDSGAQASAALAMYSPARLSAQLKKLAAHIAARSRVPFWYRDQIWIARRERPALEHQLRALFPGHALRLGLSSGAPEPAINRKASGVVLDSVGTVLAFIKVAGTMLSRRILQNEAAVLPEIARRIHCVPRLLFAGEIDGRYLTVQTPLSGKPATAKWTDAHLKFLHSLQSPQSKSAASTAIIATLPARIAALKAPARGLAASLDQLLPTLELTTVPTTIVHGDFAPWNLRYHRGEVAAFDWEYAELDGLPLFDQMHYLLQVGYLMREWTAQHAIESLNDLAEQRPLGLPTEQVRALQAAYLIENLVRLLAEGYDPEHEMLAWHRHILTELMSAPARREVSLV